MSGRVRDTSRDVEHIADLYQAGHPQQAAALAAALGGDVQHNLEMVLEAERGFRLAERQYSETEAEINAGLCSPEFLDIAEESVCDAQEYYHYRLRILAGEEPS